MKLLIRKYFRSILLNSSQLLSCIGITNPSHNLPMPLNQKQVDIQVALNQAQQMLYHVLYYSVMMRY